MGRIPAVTDEGLAACIRMGGRLWRLSRRRRLHVSSAWHVQEEVSTDKVHVVCKHTPRFIMLSRLSPVPFLGVLWLGTEGFLVGAGQNPVSWAAGGLVGRQHRRQDAC